MKQNKPELINKAAHFALNAHSIGMDLSNRKLQLRKNSNMPYIFHPMAVAEIASKYTDDSEVVAAAVLHDVLEDTGFTAKAMENQFGKRVTEFVKEVTNLENNEGTREERVNRNIQKLSTISPEGQLIKAADCNHNLSDLIYAPEAWALRYSNEKFKLLSVLTEAPEDLKQKCKDKIHQFQISIISSRTNG